MNLVIHVFDTVPDGPLFKRAEEAFNQYPKNFGLIGTWQGEQGAAALASTLGLSFPSIAYGVFCPQGIKYFAKVEGMQSVQEIYNSIDTAFSNPEPNCNQANGGLAPLSPSYGGDGDAGGGSGSGDDCIFEDLPIIGKGLSFLCGLDKWLWLGATLFGAVKTLDTDKQSKQLVWGTLTGVAAWKTAQKFKTLVPWWVYGTVAGYTAFKFKDSLPGGNLDKIKDANTTTYAYGLGTAYLLFRAYKSFEANKGNNAITGTTRRPVRRMRLRLPPVSQN